MERYQSSEWESTQWLPTLRIGPREFVAGLAAMCLFVWTILSVLEL